MRRWLLWLPLCAFGVIVAVVAWGLYRPADRTVYSRLVGQPLPDFTLAPMVQGKPGVSSADFRQGTPRLLNVFASWCVPWRKSALDTPGLPCTIGASVKSGSGWPTRRE